jgi:hypothetical protein
MAWIGPAVAGWKAGKWLGTKLFSTDVKVRVVNEGDYDAYIVIGYSKGRVCFSAGWRLVPAGNVFSETLPEVPDGGSLLFGAVKKGSRRPVGGRDDRQLWVAVPKKEWPADAYFNLDYSDNAAPTVRDANFPFTLKEIGVVSVKVSREVTFTLSGA